MKSKLHEGCSHPPSAPETGYVGAGLVVQSPEAASRKGLNGNRNYRGRFNIDLTALAADLKKQGEADRSLLKR
jgi:hypothetical protein